MVTILVVGLQERCRLKVMEELRKFIKMDNHEAIRVGDLDKAQESRQAVKPQVHRGLP